MPKLKITTKALLQSIDNRTEWRGNAKQKLYAKMNKHETNSGLQLYINI
jgi:pantothenate kinase-related protein Tda10